MAEQKDEVIRAQEKSIQQYKTQVIDQQEIITQMTILQAQQKEHSRQLLHTYTQE